MAPASARRRPGALRGLLGVGALALALPLAGGAAQAQAQGATLTVARSGTGLGRVGSQPAGIDCGGDCSEAYPNGTQVVLTAVPALGSVFSGWTGGPCDRTAARTCAMTLDAAQTVTVGFTTSPRDLEPPPPPRLAVLANGEASAQVLSGGSLAVSLALDCGGWCGGDADWWVWAETPSGPMSWRLADGAWSPGLSSAGRSPLGPLGGLLVLESAALGEGEYRFHFSLDAPDGVREPSPPFSALAVVAIGGGFVEDFEDGAAERFRPDPPQAWRVAAADDAVAGHGREIYRLRARGAPRVFVSRTTAAYADFSFAADVRLAGGGAESSSRGMGLVFRAGRSYRDGYVFHIDARGSFVIFKRVDGATRRLGTVPLRWIRSGAIRTGKGAWNRLEVVCVGDRFTFLVNGQIVREARDGRFPRGRVGVKAYGDGANADRMEFDNVVLRLLPRG